MTNLEQGLNKVLEEHQQESGLHMIGGRRRLVDRLKEFFEEEQRHSEAEKAAQQHYHGSIHSFLAVLPSASIPQYPFACSGSSLRSCG